MTRRRVGRNETWPRSSDKEQRTCAGSLWAAYPPVSHQHDHSRINIDELQASRKHLEGPKPEAVTKHNKHVLQSFQALWRGECGGLTLFVEKIAAIAVDPGQHGGVPGPVGVVQHVHLRLAVCGLGSFDLQARLDSPPPEAEEKATGSPATEQYARVARRLGVIETGLDRVSCKLLDLLKFSQRMGFVRTTTQWNDIVRDVLIWLAAERQRRSVEIHVTYADLPPLFIEPNEMFGVLVTVLRLAMETLETPGGLVEVHTSLSADGRRVCTQIRAPDAPLVERISAILEPLAVVPEELSPLHFEWALAQETVNVQYRGDLSWKAEGGEVCFVLELPLKEN